MVDADLPEHRAALARAGEQLDVDQRAGAGEGKSRDCLAPVELEGAVDVAHGDAEEQPGKAVVERGVELAVPRIAPHDAVAADDVGPAEGGDEK